MCLLVFAWRLHPRYRFVLAGNRDEFHARPAAPADWWQTPPDILAGRDLEAGGSWLGVHRSGRIAVVTNFREPVQREPGLRSRGELVVDFLAGAEPPGPWLAELARRGEDYGGFNLVAGDAGGLHYASNRGPGARDLAPGVYGLSNHRLDTPWPKVETAKARLARLIDGADLAAEPLFRILADQTQAADEALPATGIPLEWERRLSAAFIVSPEYGTRVSTVILGDAGGRIEFVERRFDAGGACTGEGRFEFDLAGAPEQGERQ